MSTTNHEASAEQRLRRFLEKWGRGRFGDIYNRVCGPNYVVTREQLLQIASRLREQKVLELMDGAYGRSIWLVRTDLVEQTMREGSLR